MAIRVQPPGWVHFTMTVQSHDWVLVRPRNVANMAAVLGLTAPNADPTRATSAPKSTFLRSSGSAGSDNFAIRQMHRRRGEAHQFLNCTPPTCCFCIHPLLLLLFMAHADLSKASSVCFLTSNSRNQGSMMLVHRGLDMPNYCYIQFSHDGNV